MRHASLHTIASPSLPRDPTPFHFPSSLTILAQTLPRHTHYNMDRSLVDRVAAGSKTFIPVYLAGALIGANGPKRGDIVT
jgi:hypothetical protein